MDSYQVRILRSRQIHMLHHIPSWHSKRIPQSPIDHLRLSATRRDERLSIPFKAMVQERARILRRRRYT